MNLKNPIKDAAAIARELRDMYGFSANVYEDYSKIQIYKVLEQWQQRTFGTDDQLFIFFSGHGTFWEFTKKGYFVPNGRNTDYSAYIELTDLGNIVTQIPCKHILLAVDACYSGTMDQEISFKGRTFRRPNETAATDKDNIIYRQLRNQSRLFIASGGKQRTPDGKEHSPFSGAILKGLRASYTYGDGLFIFNDLLGQLERVSPVPHQGELPQHEQGGFIFIAKDTEPPAPRPVDDLVFVKGGTFQMGSENGESDEKPVHDVTLTDFYIGKMEVTMADFAKFITATDYQTDADKDGGSYFWNGSELEKKAGVNWRCDTEGNKRPSSEYKHPVIHVSWNDATAYCNWLSEQKGLEKVYRISGDTVTPNWKANGYRLPTEAEWEYAARSRGGTDKWAGTSNTDNLSQYANGSGSADGYAKTASIGSFSPNSLGLYDMSGNVWEWCWDWYASDYYKKSPNTDPKGSNEGAYRVIRGGSWNNVPADLRCADRNRYFTPDVRLQQFRLSS